MAVDNLQSNLSPEDLLNSGGGDAVVLDASSGSENLVVPGGTMLLVADFSREGPDLLIEGPGGEEVVVQDYFTVENPPALPVRLLPTKLQMPVGLNHQVSQSVPLKQPQAR